MARLTFIHLILSLVSLGTGLLLISAFFAKRRAPRLNGIFLFMAVGTSLTGFLFPFHGVTPGTSSRSADWNRAHSGRDAGSGAARFPRYRCDGGPTFSLPARLEKRRAQEHPPAMFPHRQITVAPLTGLDSMAA